MEKIFASVILILATTSAFAFDPAVDGSGDAFIGCSGYHHGSYLDFYTNQDGTKIYIEVSNDGEPSANGWPVYEVLKMKKNSVELLPADYNQTLLDVVPAMNDKTGSLYYEFVTVEAKGPNNEKMLLNLNNYFGDSFLVDEDFVEPLTCQLIEH